MAARSQRGVSPGDDGLTVTASADKLSDVPAPFGIGFHPYLTVGTPVVDDSLLTIPARRQLLTDARGLPTSDRAVAGTEFDFTVRRPVGSTRLDTAYTELIRGRRRPNPRRIGPTRRSTRPRPCGQTGSSAI